MSEGAIESLKAIAHPVRFAILSALAGAERNVGEIEKITGVGQPALSQQLAVLRKAGLVSARREAKLVFYRCEGDKIGAARGALDALLMDGGRAERGPKLLDDLGGAATFATTDLS